MPERGHACGVNACGFWGLLDRCASRAPGTRASRALIVQPAPESFQGRELTPGSPGEGSNLRKVMRITSGKFDQVCGVLNRPGTHDGFFRARKWLRNWFSWVG